MNRQLFRIAAAILLLGVACLDQPHAQLTLTGIGNDGGAATSTTWDPASLLNGTLSGGNLVFTANNVGTGATKSVASISGTQKIYAEFVLTTFAAGSDTISFGIVNGTWALGDPILNVATAAGVKESNNLVGYNGTNAAITGVAGAQGDNISVAIDFGNSKIWARANGGNWNNDVIGNQNPATNTGGVSFSGIGTPVKFGVQIAQPASDVLTAKFSSASWSFTAPSGFTNL